MAESAHAYVRGSTVRFHEWLDRSDRCQVPDGPPAWMCGDCHAGSLGPVASADGRLAMEVAEFLSTEGEPWPSCTERLPYCAAANPGSLGSSSPRSRSATQHR